MKILWHHFFQYPLNLDELKVFKIVLSIQIILTIIYFIFFGHEMSKHIVLFAAIVWGFGMVIWFELGESYKKKLNPDYVPLEDQPHIIPGNDYQWWNVIGELMQGKLKKWKKESEKKKTKIIKSY